MPCFHKIDLLPSSLTKVSQDATMKENDGKAARRRFLRQLMLWGGGASIIFIVGASIGLFSSPSSSSSSPDDRRHYLLRSDKQGNDERSLHHRKILPAQRDWRWRQQKLQRQHPPGRDGEDEQQQRQFDEAEMIDKILEAKIHLVSLSVREEELERSHPSSYAGIYAHFCELNFDAHKRDPAAGTYEGLFPSPLPLPLFHLDSRCFGFQSCGGSAKGGEQHDHFIYLLLGVLSLLISSLSFPSLPFHSLFFSPPFPQLSSVAHACRPSKIFLALILFSFPFRMPSFWLRDKL